MVRYQIKDIKISTNNVISQTEDDIQNNCFFILTRTIFLLMIDNRLNYMFFLSYDYIGISIHLLQFIFLVLTKFLCLFLIIKVRENAIHEILYKQNKFLAKQRYHFLTKYIIYQSNFKGCKKTFRIILLKLKVVIFIYNYKKMRPVVVQSHKCVTMNAKVSTPCFVSAPERKQ